MPQVKFLPITGFAGNPAFSEIAIIPPQSSLVWIGGQNSLSESREIVGKGDALLQAETIKRRLSTALATAGSGWDKVVRVQVYWVAGVNVQSVYQVFMPLFAGLASPPLVGACQVAGLAHPDFLLEVSLEAVKA